MDSLYYRPPAADAEIVNQYTLAARSREDARIALDNAKNALIQAEARLNDAQSKYSEDDFSGAQVICSAEQNYEDALSALEIAEAKLRWENNKEYQRPAPKTFVQRTKALLSRIDWQAIRSPKYK